jgi:hypothetical protein
MKYQIIIFFLLFCISLFIFNTDFVKKHKKEKTKKKKKNNKTEKKKNNIIEQKKDTTTTKHNEIKENFISRIHDGMDDVLDNYCKITSEKNGTGMILDDYKSSSSLWQNTDDGLEVVNGNTSNAECKLSQCPIETCYELRPKEGNPRPIAFPEYEYYMTKTPKDMLTDDEGRPYCETKCNVGSFIYCQSPPQACRSIDQDQQNTTAWEFNESIKRWERKEFNNYLDSGGECLTRDSSIWDKEVEVYEGEGEYTGDTTLPVYYINKGPDCIIRSNNTIDEAMKRYTNDKNEYITYSYLNNLNIDWDPKNLITYQGKNYFRCRDNDQIVEYGHNNTSTGFDCGMKSQCGVCAFEKLIYYKFNYDNDPAKRYYEEQHFIKTSYTDTEYNDGVCGIYKVNKTDYWYQNIDKDSTKTDLDNYLIPIESYATKLEIETDGYVSSITNISDQEYYITLIGHDIIQLQAYYMNNNITKMEKFDCLTRPTSADTGSRNIFNKLNQISSVDNTSDLRTTIEEVLNNINYRFTHNLKKTYISQNTLEPNDVELDKFYTIKLKQFYNDNGTDIVYCIVDPKDNKTILTESIFFTGLRTIEIRYEFTNSDSTPKNCRKSCTIGKEFSTINNISRCVPCQSNTEYYNKATGSCESLRDAAGCSPGYEFSPSGNFNSDFGYITFINGEGIENHTGDPPISDYVYFANNSSIPTGVCKSCGTNMYQPKYNSLDQCKECPEIEGENYMYVNDIGSTCDICTSTTNDPNDPVTPKISRTQDGKNNCIECPNHPSNSEQKFLKISSENNKCMLNCINGIPYGHSNEKIIDVLNGRYKKQEIKFINFENNEANFDPIPTCNFKCKDHWEKNGSKCDPCPAGYERTQNDDVCVKCPSGTYNDEPGESCKSCPAFTGVYDLEDPWSPEGATNSNECRIQCKGIGDDAIENWVPYGTMGYLLEGCPDCQLGWRRITDDNYEDLEPSGGFIGELVSGRIIANTCVPYDGMSYDFISSSGPNPQIRSINDICNRLSTNSGMNYNFSNVGNRIFCCPNKINVAQTTYDISSKKCECTKNSMLETDEYYTNDYNAVNGRCVESCGVNSTMHFDPMHGCVLRCSGVDGEYPNYSANPPTCESCPSPPTEATRAQYLPPREFDERSADVNDVRAHCKIVNCTNANYELVTVDEGVVPNDADQKYNNGWDVKCIERQVNVEQWIKMDNQQNSINANNNVFSIDPTDLIYEDDDRNSIPRQVELWEKQNQAYPISETLDPSQRTKILYGDIGEENFSTKYRVLSPNNIAATCSELGYNVQGLSVQGLSKDFCCPDNYTGSIHVVNDPSTKNTIEKPICCHNTTHTGIGGICCKNIDDENRRLNTPRSEEEGECIYGDKCTVVMVDNVKASDPFNPGDFVQFELDVKDVDHNHECITNYGGKMCYEDYYTTGTIYSRRPQDADKYCKPRINLDAQNNCSEISPKMFYCCLRTDQEYDQDANGGTGGCVDKEECWVNNSGENVFSTDEISYITYSIDDSPTRTTECKTREARRLDAQDLCSDIAGAEFDYPEYSGEDRYTVTCTPPPPPTPDPVLKSCYEWMTDNDFIKTSVKYKQEITDNNTDDCLESAFKYENETDLKKTENVDRFCQAKMSAGHTYTDRAANIVGDELTCNYVEDQEPIEYPCYQEIDGDYIRWNNAYGKRDTNYHIINVFGENNVGDRHLKYYDLLDNVIKHGDSLRDTTKRDEQHIRGCIKRDAFDQSDTKYKQPFYNLLQNEVWFEKQIVSGEGGNSERISSVGNTPNRYGSNINTECDYNFENLVGNPWLGCDRVYDTTNGNSARVAGTGKIETNCDNNTDIFILNDIFTPFRRRDWSTCDRAAGLNEVDVEKCGFSPTGHHNDQSGGGCRSIISDDYNNFCTELGGDQDLELIIARVQNSSSPKEVLGCFKKVAKHSYYNEDGQPLDPITLETTNADNVYDVYEKMDIVDQYYDSNVILDIIKKDYQYYYRYARESDKTQSDINTYDGRDYQIHRHGLIRKAYIDLENRYIIPRRSKPSENGVELTECGSGDTGDTCCTTGDKSKNGSTVTYYTCEEPTTPQVSFAAAAVAKAGGSLVIDDSDSVIESFECPYTVQYYETTGHTYDNLRISSTTPISSTTITDELWDDPTSLQLIERDPNGNSCNPSETQITKFYNADTGAGATDFSDVSTLELCDNTPDIPSGSIDDYLTGSTLLALESGMSGSTTGTRQHTHTKCINLTCSLETFFYETNATGLTIKDTLTGLTQTNLEDLWDLGSSVDDVASCTSTNKKHYITKYYVVGDNTTGCDDYPPNPITTLHDGNNLAKVGTKCVDLYCNYDKLNYSSTTPGFVAMSSIVNDIKGGTYSSPSTDDANAEVVVGKVEQRSEFSGFTPISMLQEVELNAIKNKYDSITTDQNAYGVNPCSLEGEILVSKYALYDSTKCYPNVNVVAHGPGYTEDHTSEAIETAKDAGFLFTDAYGKSYHLFESKCIDVNCDTDGTYPEEYSIYFKSGGVGNKEELSESELSSYGGDTAIDQINNYCSSGMNPGDEIYFEWNDEQCNTNHGVNETPHLTCSKTGSCTESMEEVFLMQDGTETGTPDFDSGIYNKDNYRFCMDDYPISVYDKYKYCADTLASLNSVISSANIHVNAGYLYVLKDTCEDKMLHFNIPEDRKYKNNRVQLFKETSSSRALLRINIYPSRWMEASIKSGAKTNFQGDITEYLLKIKIDCTARMKGSPYFLCGRSSSGYQIVGSLIDKAGPSVELEYYSDYNETKISGIIQQLSDVDLDSSDDKYKRLTKNGIWFKFPSDNIMKYSNLLIEVPLRVPYDSLIYNNDEIKVELSMHYDGNQYLDSSDWDETTVIPSGSKSGTLVLQHEYSMIYNYDRILLPDIPTPYVNNQASHVFNDRDWIRFTHTRGTGTDIQSKLIIRIPWNIYNQWSVNLITQVPDVNKHYLFIQALCCGDSPSNDIIKDIRPQINISGVFTRSASKGVLFNFSNATPNPSTDYLELEYNFTKPPATSPENKKVQFRFYLYNHRNRDTLQYSAGYHLDLQTHIHDDRSDRSLQDYNRYVSKIKFHHNENTDHYIYIDGSSFNDLPIPNLEGYTFEDNAKNMIMISQLVIYDELKTLYKTTTLPSIDFNVDRVYKINTLPTINSYNVYFTFNPPLIPIPEEQEEQT